MTSNIGAVQSKKRSVGFLDNKEKTESIYNKELKKYLRPELLARIEEVIHFKDLDKKDLLNIIKQELKIIKKRLSSKGFEIEFSRSTGSFILQKAISANLHARDIKNLVKEIIHVPLSKFLILNKATTCITIKPVKKEIVFNH